MSACRILIVEDDLLIGTGIEQTLHRVGHEVVGTADTYDSALALTELARPDLVLMDIALHGEHSGITAANKIRECWGTPVIFVTGNTDEPTLTHARAAGPYGFLSKPFRSEDLVEAVRIAIAHHHRAEQLFASTRWLTTVLDSLTDSIIATDAEGFVRYLNPAAEKLTGWSPIEAHGKPIEAVYPLTDLKGQAVRDCLLRRALATGEFIGRSRMWLSTRAGRRLTIEDAATPIVQEGAVVGAVTIFSDISLRLEQERRLELERDKLEEQALAATEALGQTREELRALAAGLITSHEQERRRIARDLHDDLGQQVAALGMLLDRSGKRDGDVSIEIRKRIQQISSDLRKTSHALHPAVLADLGITSALDALIEQEQEAGRDVQLSASLNPETKLPVEIATAVYRIAQEALHNAGKHAAGAGVQLALWQQDSRLVLQIQDDGPGFSLTEARSRGGFGLISMQERAHAVGGGLTISTRPGEGTVLIVEVPLS